MKKLEGHLDQAVIVESWDTVRHVDIENQSKKRKSNNTTAATKRSASVKTTILDDDYDGSDMFGTQVCKYFPKKKGSTHKAAYYDGEIVDYDKE
jgi:hypothetical protein